VLGDEYADGTLRDFARPSSSVAGGQGVFFLQSGFPSVPGVTVRQFNRSPEGLGEPDEQNADFTIVSIPLEQLGGLQAAETIRVGVVVGSGIYDTNAAVRARYLDRSFAGARYSSSGLGPALLEGLEVRLAPDPDPDHDGLTTAEELARGLDPHQPDTDHDGLLDGWEVAHDFNPLSLPDGGEGQLDADGDGLSNLQEQMLGSDPRDPHSGLTVRVERDPQGTIQLHWSTVVGQRFAVQASASPIGGYEDIVGWGFPRTATSPSDQFAIPTEWMAEGTRFFRVRLVP